MLYPWQYDDWLRIQMLSDNWMHALLLYGQTGIGKMNFAYELAQSLLCERPHDKAYACGKCVACIWFLQGNHPDFRFVCPEAIPIQMSIDVYKSSHNDVASDSATSASIKKCKSPSKEIKIDQVRGLLDFCGITSHRGGRRVVVLSPTEALSLSAANALLKTLEEPPPGVLFLLVSVDLKRLLPTIVSRCRQWPLAMPNTASALAWLHSQGISDPASALAEAGGAPLAALTVARDEYALLKQCILKQLAYGPNCEPFALCEALQKAPMPLALGWLQRWVYDLLAMQMSDKPRYFPAHLNTLQHIAKHSEPFRVAQCLKRITQQRAVEQHSLNSRLVFEELYIYYKSIFRNKL
ncbi:DNA polymerase III subunit delta' [Candidatus Vallotia tarda]|uniref:DNA polymerase III, delta' subunit n=1 Tax=Candidatus Vallotiella hemipterorum TaxID=1177213 RepID=A0A916JT89_9BURK|nr:DNA polymerase III subunit delta' [Candidatus Vallotia tarda]CAG7602001.1 DNA polymerase III, delta' subunit [Candidatus Vallotia tarda]